MIPVEFRGRSFKGLITYLSRLPRDRPDQDAALRRMIFTGNMQEFRPRSAREVIAIMARHAREDIRRGLMEAAHVRGRSRTIDKTARPVCHIVLSFPPDMSLSPPLIRQAVKEALQSLEATDGRSLADHQYAVFLHHDTNHPHVHIVVNLIDHRTGRLAHPYRSHQKLQAWANRWCLAHGHDVCKARQKKYEQIEENNCKAKAHDKRYKSQDGYTDLNGQAHHLHKTGFSKKNHAAIDRADAAVIRNLCACGHAQRRKDRDSLHAWRVAQSERIKNKYDPLIKTATALRNPPPPFSLDARQIEQRQRFFRRERSTAGRIFNSAYIAWQERSTDNQGGFLSAFMYYLQSTAARRAHMFRRQYVERRRSRRVLKIIEKRSHEMNAMKKEHEKRKGSMNSTHVMQIENERALWVVHNRNRQKAPPAPKQGKGNGYPQKQDGQRNYGTHPVCPSQAINPARPL